VCRWITCDVGRYFMSNLQRGVVLCLMGPTASGKTAIAVELVQRFPMEIVSIDSAMIYRGMTIGAAKPDAATLKKAPHHLIDILDPTDAYSAAQCCEDVNALCEAIFARGRIPLLTGGTMMYFNALQKGLSSLPEADPLIRAQLVADAAQFGWTALHDRLAQIDPVSAARIHPHDTQRIQRALEVFMLTNTPLSTLWDAENVTSPWQFLNVALIPDDRRWLHERIALRFQEMMNEGLVDEVRDLVHRFALTPEHPSMKSVGYRQVLAYLQGEYDKQTLLEKGIAATRQLAKRQLTWLRHWPEKEVFQAEDPEVLDKVIRLLRMTLTHYG
jgi:tRNA dimethylallyltransferase